MSAWSIFGIVIAAAGTALGLARTFGLRNMKTPKSYKTYMASDGPKFGDLTIDPEHFQLWEVDDLENQNDGYETDENIPGFYGFGSNGAGEMLAFDKHGRIYMIPFIPMKPEQARKVADSWDDFQKAIKILESCPAKGGRSKI